VDVIFEGYNEAGYHTCLYNAEHIPSGVYFYRITVNDFSQMRKMILIK